MTSIGDSAFASNTSLATLTIGTGVTSIGLGAFTLCPLTSVILTNGRTTIPASFTNLSELGGALTIPNSVTSIGNYAFSDNSFTSVTIGTGVTTIGDYAFYGNDLTTLTIPNSVTSIGSGAFQYNSPLATVNCLVTKTIIDAATDIFASTASPLTINARASDGTWTAGTGLSIGGNTNVTVVKNL